MAQSYNILPSAATGKVSPFEIRVEEQKLRDFKDLLRLSPVAKDCYENQQAQKEKNFGFTREWLVGAKKHWEEKFDWRKQEDYLNSFPQFKAEVKDDDGRPMTVHFAALFSQRKDAVPLLRLHGWSCTFAEFLPVLGLLRSKYTPNTLPYHIIVPSLPGWTFSDPPPLDRDWKIEHSARMIHKLMLTLGFEDGYVVQGGDIGAAVSRTIASTYPECKAMHVNYNQMFPPDDADSLLVTDFEKKGLERSAEFDKTGNAYGRMQGTRPSTTGYVLSSSPMAMLAWIGEKLMEWSDEALSLETVLLEVSLIWFTESAGTSIYPYREDYLWGIYQKGYFHGQAKLYVDKPLGYSYFPRELAPIPKSWVEKTGRLVWYKAHEEGGHYPALERPEALLEDVEDFVKCVWK